MTTEPTPLAIITGGARGMGLATAAALGRDHRIVLVDLDRSDLDRAVEHLAGLGVEASGVVCDITDGAAVDTVFAGAHTAGALRAVVHSAGVSPSMGDAEAIIRINAVGTVNVTQAALSYAGPGSALVNVASVAGHMLPRALVPTRVFRTALTDPHRMAARLARIAELTGRGASGTAYSLSKAFVIWYSARMADAFGTHGARVLSVSPGSFDTDMGRLEKKSGSAEMLRFAAFKRFGDPEEIAELLAFCAGTRPGYLTGTDILCDGGTRAGLTLAGLAAMARGR